MVCFLIGGYWLTVPAILTWALAVPIDEVVGDNWSLRLERSPTFLKTLLYLQLPSLAIATFFFAYYLSDWTFLGEVVNQARDGTSDLALAIVVAAMALFYGISGINVAHELVHRTSRRDVLIGRWLLSFSLDTAFAIEHVYGHHINVGTRKDPATAPRGMGFWRFFPRILWQANRNAWRIERRFLERRGQPVWSWHNRFLTGQAMSLVWIALFAFAGGWLALGLFLFAAIWSKLYLELTNYIEHYGLVRAEGARVEPRHSWNSSRRLTNWILFNLQRHADHHVKPGKNYWELEARTDAPQLPHGYFLMAIYALVPPLFFRKVDPLVADWDRNYASDAELAVIAAEAAPGGAMVEMPSVAASSSMPDVRANTRVGP